MRAYFKEHIVPTLIITEVVIKSWI